MCFIKLGKFSIIVCSNNILPILTLFSSWDSNYGIHIVDILILSCRSWGSVNFNFSLYLSDFRLSNFYSLCSSTLTFLSSAFCYTTDLVNFLFQTFYIFSSRISNCFLSVVSIFSVEVFCFFTCYKYNFLYILDHSKIATLKSLSIGSNIWFTS